MQRMRIIGGGSIGLLLAGKLAATGKVDVELVTNSHEQAARIGADGVLVRESGETAHTFVRAMSFQQMLELGGVAERPDWVLLTVKQQAIDGELLAALRLMPPPLSGIVCWQNGIGHIERISASLPLQNLMIAVTTEGARRVSPVEVDHTGTGKTEIGIASGTFESSAWEMQAQKKLIKALTYAGFKAYMSKHIHSSVWNKLLVNAVINPLTAIWRVPNGHLLQSDAAQQLMHGLMEEALAVAALEGAEPHADIARRITEVCSRTALNRSSMLQDIEAGRITENEWISGAIVRLACKHGLSVPVTDTVYRIVQQLERGR